MLQLNDAELSAILRDDCPFSDLTTEGLGLTGVPAQATLVARDAMVVCAIEEAARLFELSGATAERTVDSGANVAPGTLLLTVQGPAGALHRAYKMAQTLMEVTSGMASAAREIVAAAQSTAPRIRIACTRKHMPGIKRMALKAIEAGGAVPHRLGLSDFVLVFDEHRALLDPGRPLRDHLEKLRHAAPERRLVVEVATLDEAVSVAGAGADIVQVDKAAPAQIAAIAAALRGLERPPLLAAAGGINRANAAGYAGAGADILVTSAPYYAPPRDVKVRITPTVTPQ